MNKSSHLSIMFFFLYFHDVLFSSEVYGTLTPGLSFLLLRMYLLVMIKKYNYYKR